MEPISQDETREMRELLEKFYGPMESRFTLRCHNPEAATGAARFTFGDHEFRALLDIKMGAKNMTLSQRITAPRLGPCPASD
jgi:hypothetical protein